MICTLVSLHERVNDISGAINILDSAVMNINENESCYTTILKNNADFKMACGRYEEAAKVYKVCILILPSLSDHRNFFHTNGEITKL